MPGRDATRLNSNNGVVFTVEIDAVSGLDVSVDYRTLVGSDDTATSDLDFTDTSGRLTIPAGQRSARVTVPVLDDTIPEDSETFTLELSNPDNATLETADSTAKGTITDDSDPARDLQITNVTVGEGGGSVSFQVRLAGASGQEVTVTWQTVNATATGGADCDADGADFANASGTLTFQAGNTDPDEADPSVTICDDSLDEPDETFGVRLRNPTNATAPADPATGLIEDNDDEPDLSVDDPSESEAVGKVTFTVTLSEESAKEVTVEYATADDDAEAGKDYTAKNGSLTFRPGDTSKTVEVQVGNDRISEADETFRLVLSEPNNATGDGTSGTATIVDNDGDPGLRVNDVTVRENARTARFTVTLEPVSSSTVTVRYDTRDGTAVAGDDYTAVTNGSLTFNPGDKTKTVDVAILSDSTAEDDETFTLVLSSPNPSAVDLDDDTGEATITERPSRRPSPPQQDDDDDDDDEDDDVGGGTNVVVNQPALAPRIGVFLNDVVLVLGDPARQIDLVASVVGAIDTYRALAADPGIVAVMLSGSKLTLAPEALGVTTVSVSAGNSRGTVFQSFRVTVIERGAPKLASFLPNQLLYVGDPPVTFDVSSAFAGTVTSYAGTAGDPNLVDVSTTGSRVSLTGLTPGVTTVTIGAINASGVAMQFFRVTVLARETPGADPPGPVQEIPTH